MPQTSVGDRALGRGRQRNGRATGDVQSCCGVTANTVRYRSRSLRLPCRQRLGARSRGGKPRQSRYPHALPVCVRAAHRDYWLAESRPDEWLLIEWPDGEDALTNIGFNASGEHRVRSARRYRQTALAHRTRLPGTQTGGWPRSLEGRGWRGFHHHATLCIAAYGFLISERRRFPPHELVPPVVHGHYNSRNLSAQRVRHCGLSATFRIPSQLSDGD